MLSLTAVGMALSAEGAPMGMRKAGLLIAAVSVALLVVMWLVDRAVSKRRPPRPDRTFPILGKPEGPPQSRRPKRSARRDRS